MMRLTENVILRRWRRMTFSQAVKIKTRILLSGHRKTVKLAAVDFLSERVLFDEVRGHHSLAVEDHDIRMRTEAGRGLGRQLH
jgi:hypothetical protein